MINARRGAGLTTVLSLLVLLAACGGSGGGSPEVSPAPVPPSLPPPPPPAVNQAPTPRFDAPTAAVAGQAAVFDARASSDPEGSALRHTWDFGDGSAAGTAQVAHVYPAAGTYSARLLVSDAQGATAELTRSVTVSAAPAAARSVSVAGRVTGIDGLPLAAVAITVLGSSGTGTVSNTSTDADGRATLSAGVGVNVVLRLSKAGYTDQIKQLNLPAAVGSDGSFEARLMPRAAAVTLADATAGGSVTGTDGASLTVPAAGLVDAATGAAVTGPVQVTMTPVDVNAAAVAAFPGRFEGVNGDGTRTPIVSFGTTEFLLSQGGRALQLKPGQRATIELPVYASQDLGGAALAAGGSLPLWSLDERSALWVNEGQGTLVAAAASPTGWALRAEVGHFSWWNADKGYTPYRPKPRCINDVPGQYDSIFEQATICKMLAEMDKPVPAQGNAAVVARARVLSARPAAAASAPRFPFPAVRIEADVPLAGGVAIDIPPDHDVVLTGSALNGTWRGQVKIKGGPGATADVSVPLRPVAAGGRAEDISLPFDATRAAAALTVDSYRFVAAAGQTVQVVLSQAGSTLTGGLRLRDPAGAVSATANLGPGNAELGLRLAVAGAYTLEFTPQNNAPGAYRLQAAFTSVLTTAVDDSDEQPGLARVAVNAAGDAVVAWTRITGAGRNVLARTFRASTGQWSANQTLGSVGAFAESTDHLQLGIDGQGHATVIWEQDGAGPNSARFDAASQSWAGAQLLASAACRGGVLQQQRLAVNARGDAWVVWIRGSGSTVSTPALCSRRFDPASASWLPERSVAWAAAFQGARLALAASADGQAVVAWSLASSGGVMAARQAAGSDAWTSPVFLPTAAGFGVNALTLATDGNGTALAGWTHSGSTVWAALWPSGEPGWRPAAQIGRADDSGPLRAAWLGGTRYHVVWQQPVGFGSAVQAATLDAVALTWGPVLTVAPDGQLLDAASDGAGAAVAAWAFWVPSTSRLALGFSRLDATTGAWTVASTPIGNDLNGNTPQLGLVSAAGGQAAVAWQQTVFRVGFAGLRRNVISRLGLKP